LYKEEYAESAQWWACKNRERKPIEITTLQPNLCRKRNMFLMFTTEANEHLEKNLTKDPSHVILVLSLLNTYPTSIIHPPVKENHRSHTAWISGNKQKLFQKVIRKGMRFLTIVNPNTCCQFAQQNIVH